MESRFDLVFTNQIKASAALIGGFLLALILAFVLGKGLSTMINLGENGGDVVVIVYIFVSMYACIWLVKKVSGEPTIILVRSGSLLIQNKKTGLEKTISYNDLSSYSHLIYHGTEQLILKLRDGRKEKLSVASIRNDNDFAGMVRAFETALRAHPTPAGAPEAVRQKSFFEKQISTVLLIPLMAAMGYLIWQVGFQHAPIKGSFFTSIGFGISYLIAWYAARDRRQS